VTCQQVFGRQGEDNDGYRARLLSSTACLYFPISCSALSRHYLDPLLSRHVAKTKIEARWRPYSRLNYKEMTPSILSWLLDASSLTQRLIAHCPGQFRVEVLDESWARPAPGEIRALGMKPAAIARIRQVRLLCNGVPWVFARTVIPYKTLQGSVRRLKMLGNRSLGEVLFADNSMLRGELEIAGITEGDYLYHTATQGLTKKCPVIWGRRSVFYLSGKPLLVNEIFLPDLAVEK